MDNITIAPTTPNTATVTIQALSWTAGIWGGLENTEFDVYEGAKKVNTNAPIVLSIVDVDNRSLIFFIAPKSLILSHSPGNQSLIK